MPCESFVKANAIAYMFFQKNIFARFFKNNLILRRNRDMLKRVDWIITEIEEIFQMQKIGFDKDLYMSRQKAAISERIDQFGGKLYLEFGGKLFDDFHAARVLPGFEANAKIKLLQEFRDEAEIIFAINASTIGANKVRADIGITYEMDLLRLMDNIRKMGLYVSSVVITQYQGQAAADSFRTMLEKRGVNTYLHYSIEGYPANIDKVVSDEGYGMNDYIPTTRPLVVVTAPGPCSGKMATCLSQLYHESKRGIKSGYAKFETFPIWNIPLKHPVNMAYEAATADLHDVNMIDPFHLEKYGTITVNYNRDIEVFPVVQNILKRITGKEIYYSPTDMGVNMAGYGIFDDEAVKDAAKQEIIRRYYRAECDLLMGRIDEDTVARLKSIMTQLDIKPQDRIIVDPALQKSLRKDAPALAIQLPDGMIMTGKGSDLMTPASSCIINSIKYLADISEESLLIPPFILEPLMQVKEEVLGMKRIELNLEEVINAISIYAATDEIAGRTLSKLKDLRGCEAHSSHMLSSADENVLRRLGVQLTSEARFPTNDLFHM